MIEGQLLLASGMLSSAHCPGMCGPFALAIDAGQTSPAANLRRHLAYSAGRIFIYAVLGAFAAFLGAEAAERVAGWTSLLAILAIAAGVLLDVQGLLAAGVLPKRDIAGNAACPRAATFRSLLTSKGTFDVVLASIFTGFLPCCLLAWAPSTQGVWQSLGRTPCLRWWPLASGARPRRPPTAACRGCMVLKGFVSIGRGAHYLSLTGEDRRLPSVRTV